MPGKGKVQPTSYIGLDKLTDRRQEKRQEYSTAENSPEFQFICPLHGKIKTGMPLSRRHQQEPESGLRSYLKSCFGKSKFENKLEAHGIKAKINKATIRTLQHVSKDSYLLTREELNALSKEQLEELQNSMENEIFALNTETRHILEEQHVIASQNEILKEKSKNLEDRVKTILRPWVNRYPHSDELTRAYLIN